MHEAVMELSLIIPAYNAEAYIRGNLTAVHDYLLSTGIDFEIVVVDDGSKDKTAAEVRAAALPRVSLIVLPKNLGKFGALAVGMRSSSGGSRIFTDADLPFDLEALPYIHRLISERNFHVVIGDRTLAESRYAVDTNIIRRGSTFLFSLFVTMVVTGGLFDTQCGLKGFRGDVADKLFPLVSTKGFSGDVELLYIALKYNLEVKRIPVRLQNTGPTTVRVARHGLRMLGSVALLKLRWMRGNYRSAALKEIGQQEYWNAGYSSENAARRTAVAGDVTAAAFEPRTANIGAAASAGWRDHTSRRGGAVRRG